jgi:D-alanyl-D-alanine carboxypeptidase (penicillin-binding protein 5/6)
MKKLKNIILILAAATLIAPSALATLPAVTAYADDNVKVVDTPDETSGYDVNANAAIAIDANSGKIFYAKNVNQNLGIASETKLLTCYLAYKAVKNGTAKWEDTVEVDSATSKLSLNNDLSNVPLYDDGTTYTLKSLVEAALIASANACASAIEIGRAHV